MRVDPQHFGFTAVAALVLTCALTGCRPRPADPKQHVAAAEAEDAVDQPEGKPAGKPAPDRSTPMAAIRSYQRAVAEGDAEALRAVTHVTTPAQERSVDAFGRWAEAGARLERVATEKFGDVGAGERIEDIFGSMSPQSVARRMAESLARDDDGDDYELDVDEAAGTAEVVHGPDAGPTRLVRVGGVWLAIFDLTPDAVEDGANDDPEADSVWVKLTGKLADEMNRTANRIEAGEFETADEAFESLQTAFGNWFGASPELVPAPGAGPEAE